MAKDTVWRLKTGERVNESDLSPEMQALARRSRRTSETSTLSALLLLLVVFAAIIAIPVLLIAAVITFFTSGWTVSVACVFFAFAAFAIYRAAGSVTVWLSKRVDDMVKEMENAGFDVDSKLKVKK